MKVLKCEHNIGVESIKKVIRVLWVVTSCKLWVKEGYLGRRKRKEKEIVPFGMWRGRKNKWMLGKKVIKGVGGPKCL